MFSFSSFDFTMAISIMLIKKKNCMALTWSVSSFMASEFHVVITIHTLSLWFLFSIFYGFIFNVYIFWFTGHFFWSKVRSMDVELCVFSRDGYPVYYNNLKKWFTFSHWFELCQPSKWWDLLIWYLEHPISYSATYRLRRIFLYILTETWYFIFLIFCQSDKQMGCFVVLMGGDNYRKEYRRQHVKCLEVEAEKPLVGLTLGRAVRALPRGWNQHRS